MCILRALTLSRAAGVSRSHTFKWAVCVSTLPIDGSTEMSDLGLSSVASATSLITGSSSSDVHGNCAVTTRCSDHMCPAMWVEVGEGASLPVAAWDSVTSMGRYCLEREVQRDVRVHNPVAEPTRFADSVLFFCRRRSCGSIGVQRECVRRDVEWWMCKLLSRSCSRFC